MRPRRPWATWPVLLVLVGVAVAPLIPPAPVSGGDEDFSATRAMATIERIMGEPRPIGSEGNVRAREAIVAYLEALGLATELQTVTAPAYYGASTTDVAVVNVLARIPGSDPTGAVAVVGHYDTVPWAPGANDDGAAVAVMLETARAILAGPPLRNDLILLFTDGEEPAPRFGSTAFVAEHSLAADIGFMVNLEALGGGGPSLLIATRGPEWWVMDEYANAVPDPAAFAYVTATSRLIGGSPTDFAAFATLGTPGVEFAYLHGSPIYHTAEDAPRNVSLATLGQQGSAALGLVRRLGNGDLGGPHDATELVYFTVAGGWLLRYPAGWSLPMALVAGVLLGIAAWRRRAWRSGLLGAGISLVALVVASVLAYGIWTLIAAWRSAVGVAESYAYLVGMLVLVIAIAAGIERLASRWSALMPDVVGALAAWWILGLLGTLLAPGLGYPLLLPALVGGLLLLWSGVDPGGWWPTVRLWVVAGVTVVLVVPPIDTFFQLAQPRPGNLDSQLLPIIVLPVALMALVVELLRAVWPPGPGHEWWRRA